MENIPKRIENPLREGLVAKVYLSAFEDYRTGYAIARDLDVWDYQITREVSERFPNLFDRRIVSPRNKPLRSKVDPFLKKLEENIRGVKLSPGERKQLREYLNGSFRKATTDEYMKVDYDLSVDAYSELLGMLTAIVEVERHARDAASTLSAYPTKISEGEWKTRLYKMWREITEDLELGAVPWTDDEIFGPIKDFSDELLDKLRRVRLTGLQEITRKYSQSVGEFVTRVLREIKNCKNNESP